jgi:hypothetical protein
MSGPPRYKALATIGEDEQITTLKERTTSKPKKIIFHVLAILAIMYAALSGVRYVSRLRLPKGFWGCHGSQRNLSSLPSHFTLPSGDTIPSVALGNANALSGLALVLNWIVYRCLASSKGRGWNGSTGAR